MSHSSFFQNGPPLSCTLIRVPWWEAPQPTVAADKPLVFGHYWNLPPLPGHHDAFVPPHASGHPKLRAWQERLAPMLAAFGPEAVQDWARSLGQPVFTGSSGRVFPQAMKASPLLRAWLARLGQAGVVLRTGLRWTGWGDGALRFVTPGGTVSIAPRVTVLALGGASWARLGSDGAWAPIRTGCRDSWLIVVSNEASSVYASRPSAARTAAIGDQGT